MRSTIESDAKAYLGVESPLTIGLNAGNVRRPGGSKVYVVTTAAVTVGKTRANGISSTPPSYLISDDSAFVTGAEMVIDGGVTAQ